MSSHSPSPCPSPWQPQIWSFCLWTCLFWTLRIVDPHTTVLGWPASPTHHGVSEVRHTAVCVTASLTPYS